jgi:hypothetical protein
MKKVKIITGIIIIVAVILELIFLTAYYPMGEGPERRSTRTPSNVPILEPATEDPGPSEAEPVSTPLPYPMFDTPTPYEPSPYPPPPTGEVITPPWMIFPTTAPEG